MKSYFSLLCFSSAFAVPAGLLGDAGSGAFDFLDFANQNLYANVAYDGIDANNFSANPAILSKINAQQGYELNYTRDQGWSDRILVLAWWRWQNLNLGLGIPYITTKSYTPTDDYNNTIGAPFNPWASAPNLFAAWQKDSTLSLGMRINIPMERIANESNDLMAWGYSMDLGLLWQDSPWQSWGFNIRNLGQQIGAYTDQGQTGRLTDTRFTIGSFWRNPAHPRWSVALQYENGFYQEQHLLGSLQYSFTQDIQAMIQAPLYQSDLNTLFHWLTKGGTPTWSEDPMLHSEFNIQIQGFHVDVYGDVYRYSQWLVGAKLDWAWLNPANIATSHPTEQSPTAPKPAPNQATQVQSTTLDSTLSHPSSIPSEQILKPKMPVQDSSTKTNESINNAQEILE